MRPVWLLRALAAATIAAASVGALVLVLVVLGFPWVTPGGR